MIFIASACSQAKYSSRTRNVKGQKVYAGHSEALRANNVSKVVRLKSETRETLSSAIAATEWEVENTLQVGPTSMMELSQSQTNEYEMLNHREAAQSKRMAQALAKVEHSTPLFSQAVKELKKIKSTPNKALKLSEKNEGNPDILYILLVVLLVLLILSLFSKLFPIISWLLGLALLFFLIYILLQLI